MNFFGGVGVGVDGLVSAIYYFPATAKQDEKWCMIQRVFIFSFECCRNNFQNLLTPLQKSNGAPLKGQLPRFRDSNLWERKTPGGGYSLYSDDRDDRRIF